MNPDDYQQEFSTPFEHLPPVEPVTHTLLKVNEVVIMPDIERLLQAYKSLHDPPTSQTGDADNLLLKMHLPQTYHNWKRT